MYTMKKDNYIGTCVHCEREILCLLLSMLGIHVSLGVYIIIHVQ